LAIMGRIILTRSDPFHASHHSVSFLLRCISIASFHTPVSLHRERERDIQEEVLYEFFSLPKRTAFFTCHILLDFLPLILFHIE
jgi:hypothetical protein